MRGSATAGTPWRRLSVVAANPRGAIYGTIVASAVIAASAAGGKSPDAILTLTVATLLVFWLAHVYATSSTTRCATTARDGRSWPPSWARSCRCSLLRRCPSCSYWSGRSAPSERIARGAPCALGRRGATDRLGYRYCTPPRANLAGGSCYRSNKRRFWCSCHNT